MNVGFSALRLLPFWVRRDVVSRYSQTLGGWAWAVAQPVAYTAGLVFLVRRVGGGTGMGLPYPAFVYPATVVWFLFANSTIGAVNGLAASMPIAAKVAFPRLVPAVSGSLTPVIDFGVGTALIPLVLRAQGVTGWPRPGYFLASIGVVTLAVGMGALLGAAAVFIRDVRNVLPFVLQIALLATPVAYGAEQLPGWLAWSPMATFIAGARSSVLGISGPALNEWMVAFGLTAAVLATGLWYASSVAHRFADVS